MDTQQALVLIAKAAYFVAAVLFILGIKRMASPVTARRGIQQAGLGMVIAVVATFGITRLDNIGWILAALAVGIIPAWLRARSVQMTAMPQQVALYNGMGGGAAAAIAASRKAMGLKRVKRGIARSFRDWRQAPSWPHRTQRGPRLHAANRCRSRRGRSPGKTGSPP